MLMVLMMTMMTVTVTMTMMLMVLMMMLMTDNGQVGPYTVHEITDLEPHSDYAVRVRAKLGDNKYSNFSETAVVSTADHSQYPLLLVSHFSSYNLV